MRVHGIACLSRHACALNTRRRLWSIGFPCLVEQQRFLATEVVQAADLLRCAPKPIDAAKLQEIVATARVRPPRHILRLQKRVANLDGKWNCIACQQWLPHEAFYVQSTSHVPISRCKECRRDQMLAYSRTLRGGIAKILGHAKSKGKRHDRGLETTLAAQDILDMLVCQEGRCAYSGVSMEAIIPNSHWRMSLERVDNDLGYTPGNSVLVAAEFNTSDYSRCPGVKKETIEGTAQWSVHKVHQVSALRRTNMDLASLARDIAEADKPPSTLRHRLQTLLQRARHRSKLRGQNFNMDLLTLLHKIEHQQGRCFYSGVPLQYKQVHTDWRMSLERLDNNLGYTEDNCVLIAIEFNTSDYSRNKAVKEIFGTAQWSRAKVQHVWGSLDDEHPSTQLNKFRPMQT